MKRNGKATVLLFLRYFIFSIIKRGEKLIFEVTIYVIITQKRKE